MTAKKGDIMKKAVAIILSLTLMFAVFAGCKEKTSNTKQNIENIKVDGVKIELSDNEITVDGKKVSSDNTQAVYTANDIVYYEQDHDFTYGEGEEGDAHTEEEAAAHTVVHITKPGKYILSGKLSAGQIAVDLGEDAKKDETAVVTLALNGVDISCSVAPAVIFYNVYECGDKDTENATKDVDTTKAGANVIIADNTTNNIKGSYVARIYEPDTVVLNEDGTAVEDADKLHKYDAAFYSKRTMNVSGGEKGDGVLNITADNEGLDSELHLTINGGNINIVSGNDGINTNEDNVSVTTVNGGNLNILVNGNTGEGDGIDSNGWIVINGGTVIAQACAKSGDAGIDSDMGIYINGGTVFASGNMLDRISESKQNYAVFEFSSSQKSATYTLKNAESEILIEKETQNDFKYLIISDSKLSAGDYTLWQGKNQFEGTKMVNVSQGGMSPDNQGENPENMTAPEGFNGGPPQKPENEGSRPETPKGDKPPQKPDGDMPDGMTPPEGFENIPNRGDRPNKQQGGNTGEKSKTFKITDGGNYFAI